MPGDDEALQKRGRLGPRFHYCLQGLGFMGCIAFDSLNQVGNQIVTALQLHIDLRPAVGLLVAESHEAVVDGDEPHHGDRAKQLANATGAVLLHRKQTKQNHKKLQVTLLEITMITLV